MTASNTCFQILRELSHYVMHQQPCIAAISDMYILFSVFPRGVVGLKSRDRHFAFCPVTANAPGKTWPL
jgi:hypothetical protein